MAIIDSKYATLEKIRRKIRFLTSSPNPTQLPDPRIDEYVNDFVLYDFSLLLRNFNLHQSFTFFTVPYQDVYPNTLDTTQAPVSQNPLYNFKNDIISFDPPAFVAGMQMGFVQNPADLRGMYPQISTIKNVGTFDGTITTLTGRLGDINAANNVNSPTILRRSVLFSFIEQPSGANTSFIDYPVDWASSYIAPIAPIGNTENLAGNPYGFINYLTGQFQIVLGYSPVAGTIVNAQYQLMQPAMPQTIMYYGGQFTLRPIPDKVYPITLQAFIRPTALLSQNQLPELAEWWELIAYGASIKIFEDRRDQNGVAGIANAFNRWKDMVESRTVEQLKNQQSPTIYRGQMNGTMGNNGTGFFSNNF